MLDKVITVHEAAELLGGSTRTNLRKIQRWCATGKLTARQDPKGTWLILKSTVKDDVK